MHIKLSVEFKFLDICMRVRSLFNEHLKEFHELLDYERVEESELDFLLLSDGNAESISLSVFPQLVLLIFLGSFAEQIFVVDDIVFNSLLMEVLLVVDLSHDFFIKLITLLNK